MHAYDDDLEFKREEYWWSIELPVRFWGGELLPIHLYYEQDERPSPMEDQFEFLEKMLARSEDYRPDFSIAFFEHYQQEIYGTVGYYSQEEGMHGQNELTPPISDASEVLSLLSNASLWIDSDWDDENESSVKFVMSFECPWDVEHGLSIEITDWKITSFYAE